MTEMVSGSAGVSASRRTNLLFVAYSVCVLAANIRVLRGVFDLSRQNPTDSHLILIPFVTLVLLYQKRDAIFSSVQSAVPAGAGLILFGLGLAWAGTLHRSSGSRDDSLTLMASGLVVLWIGGFLLCYGRNAFRAALFPLLFLGFMIPLPGALLDGVTGVLKTGSAQTVAGLFTLTGTLYHREGYLFAFPQFAIEIADECSGIRSSIALLLTTLLAGHMFLQSGWKKVLLAALVVPFAMVKNGIRIVSLTLLAMHVDPSFLTGQLHHEGGFVFFLLTLAMLAPLLVVLHNSETALIKENQ
jgi:exosortase